MKLNEKIYDVEKTGITSKESAFKIKANAKAFKILSDSLYSNKIRAIIRELSCNAYDSQVAIGNGDKPFELTLPSIMDPCFKIRDFGTGLSEEDIYEVYTTYFESTKTQSNDFVGALGLGSKSPFSYIDNFTVTSWWGGEKKVYTAFINEEGFPNIVKMFEEASSEPNGIEILLAARDKDFAQFATEAQYVYKYFPIVPSNITVKRPEYFLKGKHFGLKLKADSKEPNYMVQGPVAYPLHLRDIVGYNVSWVNELDLFFDLGELDVAASREALSLDQTTITNIKKKYQNAIDELTDMISKQVDSCATEWDARCFLINLFTGRTVKNVVYKGKEIDNDYVEKNFIKSHPGLTARWVNHGESQTLGDKLHFKPDNKIKIYVVDCDMHVKETAYNLEHGILLYPPRVDLEKRKDYYERVRKEDWAKIMSKLFFDYKVEYLSKSGLKVLQDARLKPNGTPMVLGIRKDTVYIKQTAWPFKWEKEDHDYADGGVYIEFIGGKPASSDYEIFQQINQKFPLRKIPELFGIPQKNFDFVQKAKNWKSVDEYVKSILQPKIDALTKDDLDNYYLLKNTDRSIRNLMGNFKSNVVAKDFREMIDLCKKIDNSAISLNQNVSSVIDIANSYTFMNMVKIPDFDKTVITKFNQNVESLRKKYPLVFVNTYDIYKMVEAYTKYINAIDAYERKINP
jgi:hypothetical protein